MSGFYRNILCALALLCPIISVAQQELNEKFRYFDFECRIVKGVRPPSTFIVPIGVEITGNFIPNNVLGLSVPQTIDDLPVIGIGNDAFSGLEKLQRLTLPETIEYIGNKAFYQCSNLKEINLPDGIKSIGEYAFFECISLDCEEIRLSDSLISLGRAAFCGSQIKKMIMSPSCALQHIEDAAFRSCYNLEKIIIPNKVESIGANAFNGCDNLAEITLPANLTYIGLNAFGGDSNLNKIIVLAMEPPILRSDFSNEDIRVYVPTESVEKYKEADRWRNYDIQGVIYSDSVCLNTEEVIIEGLSTDSYPYENCAQLLATVFPVNATCSNLRWSCDNETVVTVDDNGIVRPVTNPVCYGEVTVKVETIDGSGVYATCKVQFVPKLISEIRLSKNEVVLQRNDVENLKWQIFPTRVDKPSIRWTSSDENVATVYEGQIRAQGVGEALITAAADDGSGVVATCKVTVVPIPVLYINLDKEKLTLEKASTYKLSVFVFGDDKSVTWSSNNEDVASVDSNGLVTAVNAGLATITVTANDGSGMSASCEVTVTNVDGITDVSENVMKVSVKEGQIVILGKTSEEFVRIYGADGSLVYLGKENVVSVHHNTFYTVVARGNSFKIFVP